MKIIFSFLLLFMLTGCSKRISPFFDSNKYITENNFVINDSLRFSHQSYGDVNFIREKAALKKHLKHANVSFDKVLVYGKTFVDPIYEYYILVDSQKNQIQSNYFQKDTIIGGHKFTFIGIPKNNTNPLEDFKILSSNMLSGENYNKQLPSIYSVINSNQFSNQFLKGLTEFSNFPTYTEQEKWNKLQLELTYASFLGQNSVYSQLIKSWRTTKVNDTLASLINKNAITGLQNVSAEIVKSVRNEKIVMFNENHFYPNHRILLTSLLPQLKAAGFGYLALETLDQKQDSILNTGGHLDMETGFYTREQHFAELIRTAQSLGFRFVSYENFDRSKDRELAQAENLYNATFSKNPNAKVIVWAGISHITEVPDYSGKKWMALQFKEKYGIDPITFSQTDLLSQQPITQSIALVKSSIFDKKLHSTDYKIINNLSFKDEAGNFSYKNTFPTDVQATLYYEEQLKNPKEYSKKVPFRCQLLHKNEIFHTTVSTAKMRLIIFDDEGKILENRLIN